MHGRKTAWQTGISGNLQYLERFAGSGQGCGRGSYSLAGILTGITPTSLDDRLITSASDNGPMKLVSARLEKK